jgi:alpha-1,3-rhamnosyl/mannosyltransferase
VIAIEVSSAAGRPPYGGIGGAIRNIVTALLRLDPDTRYDLCYRFSRWRKGHLFRPATPNARVRLIVDPFNALVLPGDRLLHSMGIYLPRTPRIPKLLTVHDLNAVRNLHWVSPEWHEKRSRRIRKSIDRADHVVTYSAFTAGEIREEYGLPEDRVHPVLLGVDREAFSPPPEETVQRVRRKYGDYVVSIGLTTGRKNFVRLVEAVAPLKDLRLVIVGRPSDAEEDLKRAIEATAMQSRITRLVRIPHEELVPLIGAARACAVPSLYEGFGLTALEAMACGTPVVCSRAASLPEVAGEAGYMVDATDTEALSQALREVIEDNTLATQLRARGLEHAARMSWDASARQLRALYRQVAAL